MEKKGHILITLPPSFPPFCLPPPPKKRRKKKRGHPLRLSFRPSSLSPSLPPSLLPSLPVECPTQLLPQVQRPGKRRAVQHVLPAESSGVTFKGREGGREGRREGGEGLSKCTSLSCLHPLPSSLPPALPPFLTLAAGVGIGAYRPQSGQGIACWMTPLAEPRHL